MSTNVKHWLKVSELFHEMFSSDLLVGSFRERVTMLIVKLLSFASEKYFISFHFMRTVWH